jgi:hypothetical protein
MEHMKQRMEKLKADLKLTPAQQAAWTTYTQAMKPGERPAPGDREAFAKLTTPERIDKMREMRGKRMAEMDRRAEATKAFYAQLNAEQKRPSMRPPCTCITSAVSAITATMAANPARSVPQLRPLRQSKPSSIAFSIKAPGRHDRGLFSFRYQLADYQRKRLPTEHLFTSF